MSHQPPFTQEQLQQIAAFFQHNHVTAAPNTSQQSGAQALVAGGSSTITTSTSTRSADTVYRRNDAPLTPSTLAMPTRITAAPARSIAPTPSTVTEPDAQQVPPVATGSTQPRHQQHTAPALSRMHAMVGLSSMSGPSSTTYGPQTGEYFCERCFVY